MEEVAVTLGSGTSQRWGEKTADTDSNPNSDSDSEPGLGTFRVRLIPESRDLDSDPENIFRKRKSTELETTINGHPVSITMFPGRHYFLPSFEFPGDPEARFYSCSLLEVFSVQVSLADDVGDDVDDRGVYGRVEMDDVVLFHRPDRDRYERIVPDEDGSGWCTLTPSCYEPISGHITRRYGFVRLKDKDYKYKQFKLKRHDGFKYGSFSWNPQYHLSDPYKDLIHFEFCGLGGSVRINFHLYEIAIKANVEVTLLSFDQRSEDQSAADICGTIKVIPEGYSSDHESLLFRRRMDAEDEALVHPKQKIPLLRSCVAVPLKSSLNVVADLVDRRNLDTQIACGAVKFPFPTNPKCGSKVIDDSRYGKIQVTVHWIFYPFY